MIINGESKYICETNFSGKEYWKNIPMKYKILAIIAIGNRISITAKMLCKKMKMEPLKKNITLCGLILHSLGWKKWTEKNTRGTWIDPNIEFE